MKLNVGCGERTLEGWINLDIDRNRPHDFLGNVVYLPFRTDSIEIILGSHILEHLTSKEAYKFLKDSYQILKDRGILELHFPDISLELARDGIYGNRRTRWEYHRSCWTVVDETHYHYVPKILKDIGFKILQIELHFPDEGSIQAIKTKWNKNWCMEIRRKTK